MPVVERVRTLRGQPAEAAWQAKPPLWVRALRNLFWMPLCLVAALIVLELAFAWARVGEQEFLKIDPFLGFLHLENKRVTFRSEGYSTGMINSAGFRDSEHSLVKPPGVVRIAVLGDSKVEAFQVAAEETFPKLLERRLNAAHPGRFEVLNFGMSGYSTGQEYLLYLQRVVQYHPDVVILAYHIGDSDENVCSDSGLSALPRPYFSLDTHGCLQIDDSFVRHWLTTDRARIYQAFDFLRRNSRIWGVLAEAELSIASDKTFRKLAAKVGKPFKAAVSRLTDQLPPVEIPPELSGASPASVLLSSMRCRTKGAIAHDMRPVRPLSSIFPEVALPAPVNEAQIIARSGLRTWPVTAAIIRELNAACRRNGTRLVVAALPAPDNSMLYFKELRYLDKLAREDGFTFVNVHEAFPSLRPMEKSPLYLNFHFSRKGHALVADTIFDAIRSYR